MNSTNKDLAYSRVFYNLSCSSFRNISTITASNFASGIAGEYGRKGWRFSHDLFREFMAFRIGWSLFAFVGDWGLPWRFTLGVCLGWILIGNKPLIICVTAAYCFSKR